MNLFVTADKIGTPTGGGLVTYHESEALKAMGDCAIMSRESLEPLATTVSEPWGWDERTAPFIPDGVRLAHFYAGTFGNTARKLKAMRVKITYTIAAHDRFVSRREHEDMGAPFPYPHLTEEAQWQRYIEGYRLADVIICPGTVPAATVRAYGPEFADKRIVIIPHGCTIPNKVESLPKRFTVGYLGSIGPDKGVRYLLEAWKKLAYSDATLIIAGRDATSPFMNYLLKRYGGGNIQLRGWQDNVSDFYNSISLLVQPSATEGWGCEVVEAMAHARMVLCSDGAGACDAVPVGHRFCACDSDALAKAIDSVRKEPYAHLEQAGLASRIAATFYTWDKIRMKYTNLWRSLL